MTAITDGKKIGELFSIFHDGTIAACRIDNDLLELEIDIKYLAERINANYEKFHLLIHNIHDFSFTTWPRNYNIVPSTIRNPLLVFSGEVEILSGEFNNDFIEVQIQQSSNEYDYSGGILYFKADSVLVTDEGGKAHDIRGLSQISNAYWNEWSNKNKALKPKEKRMIPKHLLGKALMLWGMLLIGQFLLAAAVMYQNMKAGFGFVESAMTLPPSLFVFSLALFLISWLQYRSKR